MLSCYAGRVPRTRRWLNPVAASVAASRAERVRRFARSRVCPSFRNMVLHTNIISVSMRIYVIRR